MDEGRCREGGCAGQEAIESAMNIFGCLFSLFDLSGNILCFFPEVISLLDVL